MRRAIDAGIHEFCATACTAWSPFQVGMALDQRRPRPPQADTTMPSNLRQERIGVQGNRSQHLIEFLLRKSRPALLRHMLLRQRGIGAACCGTSCCVVSCGGVSSCANTRTRKQQHEEVSQYICGGRLICHPLSVNIRVCSETDLMPSILPSKRQRWYG